MTDATHAPRIGRYELVTRLATGGMAELFLARERGIAGLERLVVIKRILPHLAGQASFVNMFLREARIVARLSHPNVVQIHELGEEDGDYFIAMEYIHGSTLRELRVLADRAEVRMSLDAAVSVAAQGLRGLHAAHELCDLDGQPLGLVHRDVSPHNLMCTPEGHVKLLDFGVAKATTGIESTHSGHLKGKFAYMSPEQCLRESLDRRSDIFAMGIVLWELLTGARLFKRRNELSMMQAVIAADVAPPSSIRPEISAELDEVVLRALAQRREDRWATAEAMRHGLSEAAQSQGLTVDEEPIALFVDEVVGQQLRSRDQALRNALERKLDDGERRSLLHATSSASHDTGADEQIDQQLLAELRRHQLSDYGDSRGGDDGDVGSRGGRGDEEDEGQPTVVARPGQATSGHGATASVGAGEEAAAKPRWWRMPRTALVVAVVLGALSGVGLFVGMSDEVAEVAAPVLIGDPLPIAWAPVADPAILREETAPLEDYLAGAVGRPMPIEVGDSYGESSRRLLEGEVAFAMLPPLIYVRTKEKNPAVEALTLKEYDGAVGSDGLLVVRMDSPVRVVEDLRGETFCLSDRNSTTGHFLPRAFLRRSGYDPDTFIGEIHWSGSHLQVLRDLLAGRCEAGATHIGAVLSADGVGIKASQVRTLAITGHVPQDSMVAGPEIDAATKARVREALLAFDPRELVGADALGKTQRISRFAPVTDETYAPLRQAIEADRMLRVEEGSD